LEAHLSPAALRVCYLLDRESGGAWRWLVIWLAARGLGVAQICAVTACDEAEVRDVVDRYNRLGPDALAIYPQPAGLPSGCWLLGEDGGRLRLTPGGLLLGRHADCDVVLMDPRASRRHALIRRGPHGPEVLHMGTNETWVNGRPVARRQALRDGARVEVPGRGLRVAHRVGPLAAPAWALVRLSGGVFGLHRSPFVVGGGEDDLVIAGWPPGALTFRGAQGSLAVECAHPARIGGVDAPAGSLRRLGLGDSVELGGERLVVARGGGGATTAQAARASGALAVTLQRLPLGGRLSVLFAEGEASAWLAGRRSDLVAALLQPPCSLTPGDHVPDEVLCRMVWPGRDDVGEPQLNTLIKQLRRCLFDAGIDGFRLVEDAHIGGRPRICLAPGAKIDVRVAD